MTTTPDELVVADEVELEPLQPRDDPIGVVRLRHQHAVEDENREPWIGSFEDGRAALVGEDDEV